MIDLPIFNSLHCLYMVGLSRDGGASVQDAEKLLVTWQRSLLPLSYRISAVDQSSYRLIETSKLWKSILLLRRRVLRIHSVLVRGVVVVVRSEGSPDEIGVFGPSASGLGTSPLDLNTTHWIIQRSLELLLSR